MRSEVWRPAAAARNRSPREARDPARQALRPGCEELAARIPEAMPETEARVRSQKPPRWSAERRASRVWDARRLARRLACLAWHAQRVLRRAPQRLSALRLPLFWGERSKRCKTPGAEMRRGNEEVLLDASTETNACAGAAGGTTQHCAGPQQSACSAGPMARVRQRRMPAQQALRRRR